MKKVFARDRDYRGAWFNRFNFFFSFFLLINVSFFYENPDVINRSCAYFKEFFYVWNTEALV